MPTRLWRFLALAGALCALVLVVFQAIDIGAYTDQHMSLDVAHGQTFQTMRVTAVNGTNAETGGLQPGDLVTPVGGMTLRMRLGAEAAGTEHAWIVQRGTQPAFRTRTTVTPLGSRDLVLIEIFNIVGAAMLLVALLVALRRPESPAARALVTFLAIIAATIIPSGQHFPDAALSAWRVLRGPLQIYGLSQGLLFACIFPFESPSGLRAWLRRFNMLYTLAAAGGAFGIGVYSRIADRLPPLGPVLEVIRWAPLGFFPLMFVAFWQASRQSSGRDRERVQWASLSIFVGFLGPLVQTLAALAGHNDGDVLALLPLTLIAIPIGLAYTILRHRTVDVGFVINRALVLTLLSFAIVAIFGLIERTLGKLFIDASHIASRSVEIALALGLGFSLRTLHARVERFVDRIFFREHHLALGTLRAFAADVNFITDPDVAIERTVDVAGRGADAEYVALYLIADGVFGRAASVDDALPAEIDQDDPLLVRIRSTRKPALPRETESIIDAEIAFPMFVRGTLVGLLVLAPKRSGEAYDPEETALLADLTQRVGLALDALQTLALRRELDALMAAR